MKRVKKGGSLPKGVKSITRAANIPKLKSQKPRHAAATAWLPKPKSSVTAEDLAKVNEPLCARLISIGATERQMAEFFRVKVEVMVEYLKLNPGLVRGVELNEELMSDKAERALWERGVGFSHPDVHISNYEGIITITPITKIYPPDPVSLKEWLHNRRPSRWKQKLDMAHSGNINARIMRLLGPQKKPEGERRKESK